MKDLHALDATPLTVTADGKFFEGTYIFGAFQQLAFHRRHVEIR